MAFYTCGIRDAVLQIFIQNGPKLKEETMAIKESLQDSSLDQFASDGSLDTWKSAYTIKESRLVGVAEDVAEETITSCMERIQELSEVYSSENIWNMDESGCFFLFFLRLCLTKG